MSNIDINRRQFLVGSSATVAEVLLPSRVTVAAETTTKPTWDKPLIGAMPSPTSMPKRYNILLITTDQERYFDRYPFPVPGREHLMKRGTLFRCHQINSNVCTSSRSVLYTGLHMPQTRMFDNVGLPWMPYDLDPTLKTLGHLLKAAGYYSAYKGKWHLTAKAEANRGNTPSTAPHSILEAYGFHDYDDTGDIIGHSKSGYFYDAITEAQTISWLRSKGQPMQNQGNPWFLAVNIVNPHDIMFIDTDESGEAIQWHKALDQNHDAPIPTQPPHNALYRTQWPVVLPQNRHQPFNQTGRPAAHADYQKSRAAIVGDFPDEDRRWRKLLNYYYNCIRDSDTHIHNILAELDALGLTDNTIIVWTSDHGEMGGSHQMHGKGSSVYKEQVHVPLVISHPAFPGNRHCDALSCHLDIAPTLLGLAGLDASSQQTILGERKGQDLSTLLHAPESANKHAARPASLYCYGMIAYTDPQYIHKVLAIQAQSELSIEEKAARINALEPDFRKRSGIRMINDGHYKFARYFSLREHNMPQDWQSLWKYNDVELYDLIHDPDENTNLAANPEAHRELILAMNRKLNNMIATEIGVDDGSFMPNAKTLAWNLTSDQFNHLVND